MNLDLAWRFRVSRDKTRTGQIVESVAMRGADSRLSARENDGLINTTTQHEGNSGRSGGKCVRSVRDDETVEAALVLVDPRRDARPIVWCHVNPVEVLKRDPANSRNRGKRVTYDFF